MSNSIFLFEKIQFDIESKLNYNFYDENDEIVNDLIIDLKEDADENSGINYNIDIFNIKSTISDIKDKNLFSIEVGENITDKSELFLLNNISRQINLIKNLQKEYYIEEYVVTNNSNNHFSGRKTEINKNVFNYIENLNSLNNRDFIEDLNSDIDIELINRRQNSNFFISKNLINKSFVNFKEENVNKKIKTNYKEKKPLYVINKNGIKANIFIGFLLKKYKKVGDNFTFLKSNILNIDIYKSIENEFSETISFFDDAIKLNEEYYYEVAPLYCVSTKSEDTNNIDAFKSNNFDPETPTYYYLISGTNVHTKKFVALNTSIPGEPQGLSSYYNKSLNCPRLIWDRPLDYRLGISGYQIYKRSSLEKPFELIKVIMFDNHTLNENVDSNLIERYSIEQNYYDLIDYDKYRNSIYAICSIGKNKLISNLSSQILVYESNEKKNINVDFVSYAGAKREYPNTKIPSNISISRNNNDVIEYVSRIKNKNDITIYLTPDCGAINNRRIINYSSSDDIDYEQNSHYALSLTSKDMSANSKISFRVKSIEWYLTIEVK